ncbi:hypothetical protein ACFLOH_004045 [Enterobacter cloacae]
MKNKKYAILMSHNNYLYSGLKSTLDDSIVFLFHENEIDKFLNICSVAREDEILIFYDEQFRKITSVIFHDMAYRSINVLQLKDRVIENLLFLPGTDLSKASSSEYKSKIMEKKVIYYYVFYKMAYRDIATKMKIPESRVSYFINKYVRGMNFRHKNDLVINIQSS